MPTKQYDTEREAWRVEFSLPLAAAAEKAWVCGDFNDWSRDATPMEQAEEGGLRAIVWLDPGNYRYRYFLGGDDWENDWAADDYIDNEHGGTDSLLVLPEPGDVAAEELAVDEGGADVPATDRRSN